MADLPDTPASASGRARRVGSRPAPDGPNWARMNNYWLGGHDNSGADQEQAARIEMILPMARSLASSNRMFVSRAVGWAAASKEQGGRLVPGVRQFIHIGSGFPPNGRTHEIARNVGRSPSVVYVDNIQTLPATGDGTRVAAVRVDDPAMWRQLNASTGLLRVHSFTRCEFTTPFSGLELVKPGIAPVLHLRPGVGRRPGRAVGPGLHRWGDQPQAITELGTGGREPRAAPAR